MTGEVDRQAHAHDDHQRLEDAQIPAHEHEYGDGVGDAERDGDYGEDRDEYVARGKQKDEEGDEHGSHQRRVGTRD